MAPRYWLLKSDPASFGFEELKRSPKKTTPWDGVRNYQARNLMRDDMRLGDGILFYHSQSDPTAVVGTAKVVRNAYPDPSQFDPGSRYHDPGSDPDDPRWFAVNIKLDKEFKQPVTLAELRRAPLLRDMVLLWKGSRLSVQPVSALEWRLVTKLGGR